MSGALRISGYASLFDETDLSGDKVSRGAFAASILALPEGRLPMLYSHETASPIGVWNRIFEDKTGLFVSGQLIGGSAETERMAKLIRQGAVSGLSIGYRMRRAARTTTGRTLMELELWEVSVVAFPMLRSARITQIDDLLPTLSTSSQKGNMAYA